MEDLSGGRLTFRDLFSGGSGAYAAFRPAYPRALFEFLAGLTARRARAWDCATGSGQAATALAEWYERVDATDASAAQIASAAPHDRVLYRTAPAEASGLPDASIDLVTVAQALHWLDRDRFFAEARRVLAPGGVLAVWSYALARVTPAVDTVVETLYRETLGPDWLPERRLVEDGYASIAFPFEEIAAPPFVIEQHWTLAGLLGYLGTWSAVQRHRTRTGVDAVAAAAEALGAAWGRPGRRRRIVWPLAVRVGRRTDTSAPRT